MFVQERRLRRKFTSPLSDLNQPYERLLHLYYGGGAPVKVKNPPWSKDKVKKVLVLGPHKYCFEYLSFLQ